MDVGVEKMILTEYWIGFAQGTLFGCLVTLGLIAWHRYEKRIGIGSG